MTNGPVRFLSRTAAQEAVLALGWRYLLGTFCLSVPVGSLADGCAVAARAVAAAGPRADDHLRVDVRPDRVELSLATRTAGRVTDLDVAAARAVSTALAVPGSPATGVPRPVQMLELAIDTQDAARIRPFWKAVLGYVDDPAGDPAAPDGALVDPTGQLPALWFQEMDGPRPQRNRIHLDVTVAHDEAQPRVDAALAAGGRLLDDSFARSFWVLADADGNEVCVCTWLDRDERSAAEAG
jgi:4a-hydroxytetrahydrobiopterin dehydratase